MGVIYSAEWAWTGERFDPDVVLEVEDGVLTTVAAEREHADGAVRLDGLTLPGLANAHSHTFHRALRGRTHTGAGDFWSWRDRMYAVADRLDPDRYERLATACFAEMALAGVTVAGEFHYLHHGPGGAPYDEPYAMEEALRRAAAAAGIRLTLLDTLYLRSGFVGEPLEPVQKRFSDADADHWAERIEALQTRWRDDALARVGVAVHSVRAVDPPAMKTAGTLATTGRLPLHVHVSEQMEENAACLAAYGSTPTELLAANGVLGPFTTAVHATHVTEADLDLLAAEGCAVCLCPTTERDLADGVGPAWAMAEQGIPLALGSDGHSTIDLFEEARAVELDERLVHHRRDGLSAESLLAAATEDGAECLGWPEAGRLEVGRLADFVTVSLDSVRLAGVVDPGATPTAAVVFCAAAADVTDVVVAGRHIVEGRRHLLVDDVVGKLRTSIGELFE